MEGQKKLRLEVGVHMGHSTDIAAVLAYGYRAVRPREEMKGYKIRL